MSITSSISPQITTVSITTTHSVAGATIDIEHIRRWMGRRGVVVTAIDVLDPTTLVMTYFGDLPAAWPNYDHAASRRALSKTQLQAATTLVGVKAAMITLLEGFD